MSDKGEAQLGAGRNAGDQRFNTITGLHVPWVR